MAVVKGISAINTSFYQTVTAGVTVTQTPQGQIQSNQTYGNGTGAGLVDQVYSKQLTFVASTPQTINLTSLTDLSGATVAALRVRELTIQVVSGTIVAGAAGTHPWSPLWGTTGTVTVFPGTTYAFSDPISVGGGVGAVVGAGSSDQIKLDPGSGAAVVNVQLGCCSAVS